MAQIDMNKLKASTQNLTESEELKADEQPKAQAESVELINNATEGQKDINETDTATEQKAETGVAVVCYIGSGVWKDSKKCLWANENKTKNILSERKYPIDEYEERDDLKFMVKYGAMKVIFA